MTIRQALLDVAKRPHPDTDVLLDVKTHEMVARTLFDIANKPGLEGTRVDGPGHQGAADDLQPDRRHPSARHEAGF